VAVTGATGLLGSSLVPTLTTGGAHVIRVGRGRQERAVAGASASSWDPVAGVVDTEALEGCEAVVHLAGRSIAKAPYRWTARAKQEIYESRVQGTRVLCEALAKMRQPPKVLVMASGVSYYGDTRGAVSRDGGKAVDESGSKGSGADFLAGVVEDWEAAAEPARAAGIRVVFLRYGMVLSPAGGALALMLPVFGACAGGRLGNGEQYLPWISLDDAVGSIVHAICAGDALTGPVNVVGPVPATNAEFTQALGGALWRPAVIPVPRGVLRTLLGQFADETLLLDQKLRPAALLRSGYCFRHEAVGEALRHLLGSA